MSLHLWRWLPLLTLNYLLPWPNSRQLWNLETQLTRFLQRQLQMQKRRFVRSLLQLGLFLQKFSPSLHLPALFQHWTALIMPPL